MLLTGERTNSGQKPHRCLLPFVYSYFLSNGPFLPSPMVWSHQIHRNIRNCLSLKVRPFPCRFLVRRYPDRTLNGIVCFNLSGFFADKKYTLDIKSSVIIEISKKNVKSPGDDTP
jgi:hypothetical protein